MLFCDLPLFGASLELISTEKNIQKSNFFSRKLFVFVSYSREGETVIIQLNQKLSFVLFANRRNSCMSIKGQFQYKIPFLFFLYDCIRIRTQGRVLEF